MIVEDCLNDETRNVACLGTEEDKSTIIRYGIQALLGEEI